MMDRHGHIPFNDVRCFQAIGRWGGGVVESMVHWSACNNVRPNVTREAGKGYKVYFCSMQILGYEIIDQCHLIAGSRRYSFVQCYILLQCLHNGC